MEVIEFFTSAVLVAMFITGLKNSTESSMIMEKAYKWLDGKIGEASGREQWYFKPLIGCARCMRSVYGTAGYFIIYGWQGWQSILLAIFFFIAVSGFASMFYKNS